ncbi:hypothetical protein MIND_01094500 [Mycena indigotica]|uniref:F-box domain-containing protein n=1 Tax=Mycena indigotica TaxID=2126181 RepID=A0A8H6SB69_9AGAR|nr:uncharacterized protein MIND_01094500 [Mycena indigotica]KAF7295545.1 hypothetical protein MIND_01094500 [Mycena indigotica]
MVLQVLGDVWAKLRLWKDEDPPISFVVLPVDIMNLIFDFLQTNGTPNEHQLVDLLSLSLTCRDLRFLVLPRLFRRISSDNASRDSVWPISLWPFFRTLQLHDRDQIIFLSSGMLSALSSMPAVTKIVLSTKAVVPAEFFVAASAIATLQVLELRKVRLDGQMPSVPLTFPSLSNLVISIVGPQGVTRVAGIDTEREKERIVSLLTIVAPQLETLAISGELLSPPICDLAWPKLREFTVTEHTPIPYIPTPRLLAHMPALHSLALLYTMDIWRDEVATFKLGTSVHDPLINCSPNLTAVTLSNMGLDDPILDQLPPLLDGLSLVPMWDLHNHLPYHNAFGEVRFFREDAMNLVRRLSRFNHLTKLEFLVLQQQPRPPLIDLVATLFPALQSLHLGYNVYRAADVYLIEMSDMTFISSLRGIQNLRHLKFSLDIYWSEADRGAPATAAYILLQQIPTLQTVSYRWRHYSMASRSGIWYSWDRSVLSNPIPPQLRLALSGREA